MTRGLFLCCAGGVKGRQWWTSQYKVISEDPQPIKPGRFFRAAGGILMTQYDLITGGDKPREGQVHDPCTLAPNPRTDQLPVLANIA